MAKGLHAKFSVKPEKADWTARQYTTQAKEAAEAAQSATSSSAPNTPGAPKTEVRRLTGQPIVVVNEDQDKDIKYEINVTLHLRPTESGDRPPVAADLDGPGVVALAAGDGGAGTGGDGAAGAVSGTFFCDRRIVFKVPTDWRKTSTNQPLKKGSDRTGFVPAIVEQMVVCGLIHEGDKQIVDKAMVDEVATFIRDMADSKREAVA